MKPDIFKTITFFETVVYSEPSQIYTMKYFIQNLSIAYLDSWYTENLSISRTQDIQNTENL